jgi:hypothetical protein
MMSGSTSTTTSARDTRCSGAACPISTCHRRRPAAGFHPAARARPVLLNLGEPAPSTSRRGRIGSAGRRQLRRTWELPALGRGRRLPAPC